MIFRRCRSRTSRSSATSPSRILITGVGGTGVVTIGAFLGMAAHLEGKCCGSTDMAGLAQKGGAVHSHIKIAAKPEQIHAIGVGAGGADLVIGCDLVVSGTAKVLAAVRPGETGVVINTAETYPGDFTRDADFTLPVGDDQTGDPEGGGQSRCLLRCDESCDGARRHFGRGEYLPRRLRLAEAGFCRCRKTP